MSRAVVQLLACHLGILCFELVLKNFECVIHPEGTYTVDESLKSKKELGCRYLELVMGSLHFEGRSLLTILVTLLSFCSQTLKECKPNIAPMLSWLLKSVDPYYNLSLIHI